MTTHTAPGRDLTDRRVLILLVVTVGVLSLLLVLPYLSYVLAAVVLAYVLAPLQRRLEPRFGRTVAAAVGLVVATVAILFPVGVLVSVAIDQAITLAAAIGTGDLDVESLESQLAAHGLEIDLQTLYGTFQEPIGVGARGLAADALGIVGGFPGFLIGVTVLLFVLYSLLRDGDRLVAWSTSVLPLRDDLQDELVTRIDRLMWASIVASVLVAAVQSLLTTIGLAIVGIPGLAFFGILTFVLALLPLIGAFVVWAPIAIYLVVVGQPLAGAFLFAYGAVVVSLADNFLRPITVGRSVDLSAAVVVVGIFGGVAFFGVMGLFFGPMILGAFKTTFELYARERDEPHPQVPVGLVGIRPGAMESSQTPAGDTREENRS
ncbi:AI-2E family transporter [Natribaculum luteum]|uniref:AI-2E family transporter n=1 Tax=Natribaculum luteum TaxID=1586232 RepID=A0ABD5P5M8_9EURY|nr:AI-2E family transporter [Natribaculum luteum]